MKQYVAERAALENNAAVILRRAGKAAVWAVLKGNGYGLGVRPMAELLRGAGIDHFAVTEPSEAETIRRSGRPEEQILMLRATTDREELKQLMALRVILTIGSPEDAAAAEAAALELGLQAQVHVKADTGMGRYGFLPDQTEEMLKVFSSCPQLRVCGMYTHFHSAFCSEAATRKQYRLFCRMTEQVRAAGFDPGHLHCCNSSAFFLYPEMHMDGVRVGSALLGRLSIGGDHGLKRVGFCEATVDELRWLPKGHTCGYGAGWTAKRPTRIAVIPVGYWHGFGVTRAQDLYRLRDGLRGLLGACRALLRPRRLTVRIGGRNCEVLGHVGMLHAAVDVTDCSCQIGETAVLEINPLQLKGMDVVYR